METSKDTEVSRIKKNKLIN